MDRKAYSKLSAEEERVIIHKGTEAAFSGKYDNFSEKGIYRCKRCNAPLYRSDHKFPSSCGWPSFDDEIEGTIKREIDADGRRIEILCENCGAHLAMFLKGKDLQIKMLDIVLILSPWRLYPRKKTLTSRKLILQVDVFGV